MKNFYLNFCFLTLVFIGAFGSASSLRADESGGKSFTPAVRNPFVPQLPLPELSENESSPHGLPLLPEEPASLPEVPMPTIPVYEVPDYYQQVTSIVPQESQLPNLKISGIVWNVSRPQAIINGQILSIGDKIEDAEITAINAQGIEIKFHERIEKIEF